MTMEDVGWYWNRIPQWARAHLEDIDQPDYLDVPPSPDGKRVIRK